MTNPPSWGDTDWWTAWLGRYTLDKVSRVPKVILISVRNGE